MNIEQIKAQLGIPSLQLQASKDQQGKEDGWLRHWDNDNRTAVSIHKETADAIKADKSIAYLGLQKETRTAANAKDPENADYTAYRIVKYNEPDMVL